VSAAGAALLAALPDDILSAALRGCCPVEPWVSAMMRARPFTDNAAVHLAARRAFDHLDSDQWREGFIEIGAPAIAPGGESGTRSAAEVALRLYHERFGYPFVSAVRHMVPDELLMRARIRLGNDDVTELRTAADELRRIAAARIDALLERGAGPA
jgi:2-oxo-4-hydroxy-4-carboxy-5-ureidoimidazoline decarboxylase